MVPEVESEQVITVRVKLHGDHGTIHIESRHGGPPGSHHGGGSKKVKLCYRTGNGRYHKIEVSVNAERAHRAHGDGAVGDPVPAKPRKVFNRRCRLRRPS